MQIINLEKSHLEEAVRLFRTGFEKQRQIVPILDENHASSEKVVHMLEDCLTNHPGVAALEGDRLIGYLTGFYIGDTNDRRVICTEWSHGSADGKVFETYRLMYKAIAQKWVSDGCFSHAINFFNHAREQQDAFCWNGFGSICVDAIRPVEPIDMERPKEIRIDLMQEKDIPAWLPLVDAQKCHLAESPVFMPYNEPVHADELYETLREPGNHAWMVWKGSEAIGYMKISPGELGAAWIVDGAKKIAINGAYVKPEYRGKGISKLLLSSIMEWAQKEGFERCSVDFEATNLEACRFWLRYFQPVCRSMNRHLK